MTQAQTIRPTVVHWMAIMNRDGTDSTFCGKSRRGMPKALWSYGVKAVTCWKCIGELIQDYRDAGNDERADEMVANIKRLRKAERDTVVAVKHAPAPIDRRDAAFARQIAETNRLADEHDAKMAAVREANKPQLSAPVFAADPPSNSRDARLDERTHLTGVEENLTLCELKVVFAGNADDGFESRKVTDSRSEYNCRYCYAEELKALRGTKRTAVAS